MARIRDEGRNDSEVVGDEKALKGRVYARTAECRSYNSQLQPPRRRAPRHLLEAWYFWPGIALLVVSVIFSVYYPVDVTHLSTVIGETIGNSISQEPIKTRYL